MSNLEEIRHSMYTRAERWWWCALASVVIGVFSGLASIYSWLRSGSVISYVVVAIAALAPFLAAAARRFSGTLAARADLCRRAFLYRSSLGIELEPDQLRLVALWPSNIPLNKITASSPYFSSTTPVGPDRLAEAVGESAFYTAELARIMGNVGIGLVLLVAVLIFAALSALSSIPFDATTLSKISVIIAIVATGTLALLFGEILVTALGYKSLEEDSLEVFRSATHFAGLADKTAVTAIRIAETYSIALAANLPIPNFLYRWNRDRIDRAYKAVATAR